MHGATLRRDRCLDLGPDAFPDAFAAWRGEKAELHLTRLVGQSDASYLAVLADLDANLEPGFDRNPQRAEI